MNPQNPSKPVMDVSAPRPLQQSPAAVPQAASTIAVHPAPPAPAQARTPSPMPAAPLNKEQPKERLATKQQPSAPQQPKSGAPVGVITVAVLVMMLLSAAAVILYVTSQTA